MGDVYGTADPDAPVGRIEFERAMRHLNLSDLDLRDALLQLAARVVALTDEVTRRIDGVEPQPAPAKTPARPVSATVEDAVDTALGPTLEQIRIADAGQPTRVSLDFGGDKYTTEPAHVPCDELIHLCHGRCCRLTFSLSTQDLDERVIRWDYGQPYLIRQRKSDGYCVHSDPMSRACTVHAQRPRTCRAYDCRNDKRIWTDFENKIPAPHFEGIFDDRGQSGPTFDLVARARNRLRVIDAEKKAIGDSFAEAEPKQGPAPR